MSAKRTIFLAEDDEDDQELIQIAFNEISSDHDLRIASNGQEALDILFAQPSMPCLIILDLNMPVLNGIQTLKALNREPGFAKVPKVILTTSDAQDNKEASFTNGAADYFIKPSSIREFVAMAKKILSYCA